MAEVEKYAPWIALAGLGGVLAWLFYELYLKPRPTVVPAPSERVVEKPTYVETPTLPPAPVIITAPAVPQPVSTATTVEEMPVNYMVYVIVSDQDENPLPDAEVEVDGMVQKTDANGYALFELTRDKTYRAKASKAGYESDSTTFKVYQDGQRVPLKLVSKTARFIDVEITYGSQLLKKIHVRGRLVDHRGNPLAHKTVVISEERKRFETVTAETNDYGIFTADIDPPQPGIYWIILSYAGDEECHGTASIGHRIDVPQPEAVSPGGVSPEVAEQSGVRTRVETVRPTPRLVLEASQNPGELKINCRATLTVDTTPLKEKTVIFSTPEGYAATGVTGDDGVATGAILVGAPKSYTVTAQFPGDTEYAGVSDTKTVEVVGVKRKATITIAEAKQVNSNLSVKAVLKDEKGNPIGGKILTAEVSGPVTQTLQAETGSDGSASFTWNLKEGTYTVKVSLKDDPDYEDASATTSVAIVPLRAEFVVDYVGIVGEKPKAGVTNLLSVTLRNRGTARGDVRGRLWVKDMKEDGKIVKDEWYFWFKDVPPEKEVPFTVNRLLPKYEKYGMEWSYTVEVGVGWNGQEKSVLYIVSKSTDP
jgi:hypothetical protein